MTLRHSVYNDVAIGHIKPGSMIDDIASNVVRPFHIRQHPPFYSSVQAVTAVAATTLFCFSLLSLFNLSLHAADLKIAVAANFHHPLETIVKDFKAKHPDVEVEMVSGASSKLATQLSDGNHDFDLFLSADDTQPEQLEKEGLIVENSRKTYALGKLVMWHRQSEPIDCLQIQTYLTKHLPAVIIADPGSAPYGQRAVEAMKALHVYDTLNGQGLIKTSQHVHDAWNTVNTGNATVGFVALSLLLADSSDDEGPGHQHGNVAGHHFTEVPQELYTSLKQQMVVLKSSDSPELAEQFADFLLSSEVQKKIALMGYKLASTESSPRQSSSWSSLIIVGVVSAVVVTIGLPIAVLLYGKLRRSEPQTGTIPYLRLRQFLMYLKLRS